jgi:hypothetical protein
MVDGMKKLTRLSPGHVFKRARHVAGRDKPARLDLLLQVFLNIWPKKSKAGKPRSKICVGEG